MSCSGDLSPRSHFTKDYGLRLEIKRILLLFKSPVVFDVAQLRENETDLAGHHKLCDAKCRQPSYDGTYVLNTKLSELGIWVFRSRCILWNALFNTVQIMPVTNNMRNIQHTHIAYISIHPQNSSALDFIQWGNFTHQNEDFGLGMSANDAISKLFKKWAKALLNCRANLDQIKRSPGAITPWNNRNGRYCPRTTTISRGTPGLQTVISATWDRLPGEIRFAFFLDVLGSPLF